MARNYYYWLVGKGAAERIRLCWSTTQQHTADAMKSHVPKQSKVLSEPQVIQYFQEAPSTDAHLCRKVIASVVIAGGLRVDSLYQAELSDIERTDDDGYRITLKHLKQVQKVEDRVLEFSPHQEGTPITHPSQWLDRYLPLRKANTSMTAFMLQVRNNNVTAQRVGENTMRSVWSTIAEFVGAEDSHLYTGHGMKRFSVSLAVGRSFTAPQLQAQFKWRSAVADGRHTCYQCYRVDIVNDDAANTDITNGSVALRGGDVQRACLFTSLCLRLVHLRSVESNDSF